MKMASGDLGMVVPSTSYMSSSPNLSTVSTEASKDQFPAGLRVLVVDDDHMTLVILEAMLRRCSYKVTTCGKATAALAMLRENKNMFDLVISDVYMPDMDGFKLLELVGLEMDLPVIMMSTDGDYNNVMKGITHGACDYLLKPVRMEELRNIWQHVVRKRRNEARGDQIETTTLTEGEKQKRGASDDVEHTSSANSKKRKDVKEEDEGADHDSEDPSSLKKPRVVWSPELHQQFVNAVTQLTIDKAVPKKILELMDVPGLTRENVASHLQKYRLYLRRLSNQQPQNTMNLSFAPENGAEARAHTSYPLQTLPAVQQGVLGRIGTTTTNGLASSSLDQSSLLQLSGIQSGPVFRPNMSSPVFSSQNTFLPAFSGGYQLEQAQQVSSYGLSPVQQQIGSPAKHPSMSSLGGLTGTFCSNSQNNNPLMLQLLQQRHQQFPQSSNMALTGGLNQTQGSSVAIGGSLAQPRAVVSEVTLGVNNGLSDAGYTSLAGLNAPVAGVLRPGGSAGGIENKNVNMLGVVESNFTPASMAVSAVSLVTTPLASFDGQGLNAAVANVNTAGGAGGFGLNYNQMSTRRTEWPAQEVVEVSSPIISPSYNQSVGSHNFNNIPGHGHAAQVPQDKFEELGRVSVRENNNTHSEQSTADSSFKPKVETIPESLISAKLGLQIDQAPASDDLLNFYLKQQQQEDLSFVDNDLAFDGYVADNLYVK